MKLATYIISLPTATSRREKIQQVCKNIPLLDYSFVEAVAGNLLSYSDAIANGYNQSKRKKYYFDLELNEIACFLSHRKTLDIFLASDEAHCLILEDDAIFFNQSEHMIRILLSETAGWDIVKLDCRDSKKRGLTIAKLSKSDLLYAPLNASRGSTAILYSRSGAKKLRQSMNDFFLPFDTHIGHHHFRSRITITQVFPSVVSECNLQNSTIGNRYSKRRSPGCAAMIRRRWHRIHHSITKRAYLLKTISKVYVNHQNLPE